MTTMLLASAVSVATNLSAVVVEASRIDRTPAEIPSAVKVIGSREIAASGARDVVDLLVRQAPNLHVRRLGAGNPALAEVSLRGYGENGHGRTLVLVDGERLNSPDLNAPNLSRIAINGVDRIEIMSGAQTVLHGDAASAGVINIVTEPQSWERKSYAEASVGSWGAAGAAAGTRGGIAEEGIKYWADGAYSRSGGYRDHSSYDLWNFTGGVKREWETGIYLRFSGFYSDAQYDLPGALSRRDWLANPRQSHATVDKLRRGTYGFNSTFNVRFNDENALKLTGNFSNRRMSAYQQGTGWYSDNLYDINSYRLLGEWLNESRIAGFDQEFVLGAQYATDRLDGLMLSNYSSQSPRYNRQAMDFYAQETLHFTEWLALQFGGRYSRAWSFNSLCESDSRADDLGAFEAALFVNPVENAKIYLKETRFFRNPFLDEVPGHYDAGWNWVNTNILKPETGWSTEIGAQWSPTDELTFGADAYLTRLENEIFYNAVAYNNENCEDATWRHGFDAYAGWEREKTAGFSVAASYVKAVFGRGEFDGNRIPLVPELTLSATGRVWLWDDCHLFGGYRHQSSMFSCSDFGNRYDKLENYSVFHLGAAYEPSFAEWLEGWKFTVCVDNLLDEQYCDYSTYGANYYPAAGRSLNFSVRYEF